MDIGKLSKALLGLALAEAERQAQTEQAVRDIESKVIPGSDGRSGGEVDG